MSTARNFILLNRGHFVVISVAPAFHLLCTKLLLLAGGHSATGFRALCGFSPNLSVFGAVPEVLHIDCRTGGECGPGRAVLESCFKLDVLVFVFRTIPKLKKIKASDYKDKNVFGVPLLLNVQRTNHPLPIGILQALDYLRSHFLDQV